MTVGGQHYSINLETKLLGTNGILVFFPQSALQLTLIVSSYCSWYHSVLSGLLSCLQCLQRGQIQQGVDHRRELGPLC